MMRGRERRLLKFLHRPQSSQGRQSLVLVSTIKDIHRRMHIARRVPLDIHVQAEVELLGHKVLSDIQRRIHTDYPEIPTGGGNRVPRILA